VSAYLELQQTGRLGEAGAELLYRVAGAAVRHGRFPPPRGGRWTEEDIEEVAHDFLVTGGSKRLTTLFLRATDDASLERLLFRAVTNHLRDEARRRDHGPLLRALTEAANDASNLLEMVDTPVGRAFTGSGVSGEAWAGDECVLISAALEVTDVKLLRWRSSSRRSPVAERESLVAVLSAVVEAAGRPVPADVMLRVVAWRFGLHPTPTLVDLDDEPEPAASQPDPAEAASVSEAAGAIFDQLSGRERLALLYHDLPVRELADVLGTGKSTAANVLGRVRAHLASALADDDVDEVVTELVEMIADWTERDGSSSDQGAPDDSRIDHTDA
jgi:DNA-directed RNA polymerase specialized sigma24 family protein